MLRACLHCGLIYRDESEHCGVDGSRIADTERDPLVGRTVGRYQVVEYIGMGGVAALYRARHLMLGHDVALKVMFGEMASVPTIADRFRREARTACRIHHKNVVTTFDYGTADFGTVYLAMELLPGRTLADVLYEEGSIAAPRARDLGRQMARGLAAIHAFGYVHRDIKPSNIMLVEEDGREQVKLLDFGLVHIRDSAGKEKLTREGALLGTPCYMAPEVICGDATTTSIDLYGLGATIYEMLCGYPPFEGSMAEILVQHLRDAPPPLPPCGDLEPIVMALLEKRAKDRPESAEAVVALLEGRAEDAVVLLEKPKPRRERADGAPTWMEPVVIPPRRKLRWIGAPLGTAALACLVLAGGEEPLPAPAIAVAEIAPPIQTKLVLRPAPPQEFAEPVAPPAPAKRRKPRRDRAPAIVEVSIDSSPRGARVSMPEGVLGITPLTAFLPSNEPVSLVFEKDGVVRSKRW